MSNRSNRNKNSSRELINTTTTWMVYDRQGHGIAPGERVRVEDPDDLTRTYLDAGYLAWIDDAAEADMPTEKTGAAPTTTPNPGT